MKHFISSLVIILCFSFGKSTEIIAQSDVTQSASRAGEIRYQDLPYGKRKKFALKTCKLLNEGTLIVRLMSFDSKINHLKKVGQTEEAEKIKNQVDGWNKFLISEFTKYYDFSDIAFAYGKELNNYFADSTVVVFRDENLALDSTVKIKEGPVYILAAQGNDKYYLYDQYMNRIPEPAPHAINYFADQKSDGSLDRMFEIIGGYPAFDTGVYYFNYKLSRILRKGSFR